MMVSLYRGLLRAGEPLLDAWLRRRQRAGREDPARAHERRGRPIRPRPRGPLLWIHAASVGESLSVLSLIARVLADRPGLRVMVTTGTVTSAKLMHDRLPQGAFHQYIPADHPRWVESFLDYWKPDAVLWTESELWPNMLLSIKRRGIPAALLNARMSEKSFRLWKLARGSAGAILGTFRLCLAQDAAEKARLETLGAVEVSLSPNLKYAAPHLPVDQGKLETFKSAVGGRPLWVYASTHPGEEEIGARVHQALAPEMKGLLTVIVPRHPARGGEIADLLKAQGVSAVQRSSGRLPSPDTDVYIADTLGELGLFFRAAPVVVMGGTFVPHGGHNPIEPAQLGACVCWGPHMFNFVAVREDFLREGAAVEIADEAALAATLKKLLVDPSLASGVAEAGRAFTAARAGAVDEIMRVLEPVLSALPEADKIIDATAEG